MTTIGGFKPKKIADEVLTEKSNVPGRLTSWAGLKDAFPQWFGPLVAAIVLFLLVGTICEAVIERRARTIMDTLTPQHSPTDVTTQHNFAPDPAYA